MGSQGKGLFVLQKNHKTFDNFQSNKNDNGSIPGNLVNDIFQDNQNRTWVATDKGLSQFNGNSFVNYSIEDGLSSQNVKVVFL